MFSQLLFGDFIDSDGHPVLINLNEIQYIRPFEEGGQELLEFMMQSGDIFIIGTMNTLRDTLQAIAQNIV